MLVSLWLAFLLFGGQNETKNIDGFAMWDDGTWDGL